LLIYLLQVTDDLPKIAACVALKADLRVVCSCDDEVIPASQYSDLVVGPVQQLSQLVNLMARVKTWQTDMSSTSLSFSVHIAITVLETALDNLPDRDSDEHRKIAFVTEQLCLIMENKFGRHYSPQLTTFAVMIHAASSAAYNMLLEENILCLPSTTTLKKVTRKLHSSTKVDNLPYLKLRVSKLNEFERSVLLIIVKIYIARRVGYSSGEVLGLTADGNVASTLLCFMVKSVAGRYKDFVAIYPTTCRI